MSNKPSKGRIPLSRADRIRLIVGGILALLFLAGAAAVWLLRDRFGPDDLKLHTADPAEMTGTYTYEAASDQRFACLGSSLVVARGSGFELLDENGLSLASRVTAMQTPAISAGEDYAAVYDLGGRSLFWLGSDGSIQEQSFDGDILLAEVSPSGHCAVVSRETGYHALVSVWNSEHREVYRWYAGSAWPLGAAVSPDGKTLAVLCVSGTGSEVKFFALDSEIQKAAFAVSDTVLLDLHWFSNHELCAYSDERALFFSADGSWSATYDFGGKYLSGCAKGGNGFISFALSLYRSGSAATLVSLDAGGRVLGETQTDSQLLSMQARNSELLVLCAGGATLYSPSLSEKGSASNLSGFKQALLRSKGEALLLAAGFAEIYKF